jgi:hypothetical protein
MGELNEGDWSTSHPWHFTHCSLYRRIGGPQSESDVMEKRKTSNLYQELNPESSVVQCIA